MPGGPPPSNFSMGLCWVVVRLRIHRNRTKCTTGIASIDGRARAVRLASDSTQVGGCAVVAGLLSSAFLFTAPAMGRVAACTRTPTVRNYVSEGGRTCCRASYGACTQRFSPQLANTERVGQRVRLPCSVEQADPVPCSSSKEVVAAASGMPPPTRARWPPTHLHHSVYDLVGTSTVVEYGSRVGLELGIPRQQGI